MNKAYRLLLFIFLISCSNEEGKRQVLFAPKVIESKGVWQNPKNFSPPIRTLAGTPYIVSAGKGTRTLTHSNVHISEKPKVVAASTPNTGIFLLPKTVPAHGIIKRSSQPEFVVAKDMATKDQNPANFSFYKTLQGLKHNSVCCLLQDKIGNIWFGSYGGGACRYDGKFFTYFTEKEGLADNFVLSMLEDKAGNIWFGTNGGGVCRYDGKFFTRFSTKEGLSNDIVLSMLEDKTGTIWFGTSGGGVCRYNGKFVTHFSTKEGLSNDVVLSMLEDKTGNIWFGTNGGGVCRYNGKFFTQFSTKEGLSSNIVLSMLEDKTGNIWFGTNGGGVCRYNGNRVDDVLNKTHLYPQQGATNGEKDRVKTFTYFTETEGLPNNVVNTITEDKTGNIWFGTNGSGVCRYNGNRVDDVLNKTHLYPQQGATNGENDCVKTFTYFTENEGLPNNFILGALKDRAGNIWYGTNGGGVCRYNGAIFNYFAEKKGFIDNFVLGMSEDVAGNIWFGTYGGGVYNYNGTSFTHFTEKEGFYSSIVWSVLNDKSGGIWFGTNGSGACRYDGTTFSYYTKKEGLANTVLCMLEDKEGTIWFGTKGNGAYRYDGKTFTRYTEKEGLSNNTVLSMLEDKEGTIWFGTEGGGACCYNGSSFTYFTEKEGLSNNVINTMIEDKMGTIWFGTDGGGVCCYNGIYFTHFSEKEGLINNTVLNLLQDNKGSIWLGTRNGLSEIKQMQLKKLAKKKSKFDPVKEAFFYNYDFNDGFLGLNCRRNAVFQDSKGKIWWGADLLTCYNPQGDVLDTDAPVVRLNSVKLFGEEIAWSNRGARGIRDSVLGNGIVLHDIKFEGIAKWYPLPEHLSLPYNNNNLTFNFIGIHIQSHDHIKYQFQLEGMDPNWSSITDKTEASYGNLSSGDYVFKVKAMNQNGVWSKPFEFKFEVRPPWWKTWWFKGLVIVLCVSCVWFYIQWRERALKEKQKELEVRVDEATQEIKEQKEVVETQKHLIEERHKEITDSINYAERIQRSLLASKNLLDENLTDYFVLFKPKDIVSGDFYWAKKLSNHHFSLMCADSTGHGVPGAIMSILNISCLEKAVEVERLVSANEILNYTRTKIIATLKEDGSTEGGKDGMDGSLLNFDFKNSMLYCSSANNPIWVVRNNELIEIKSDRFPIGKHERDNESFTLHSVSLRKGDTVYALTDGFPDQFGGPLGKKFKYKPLQELVLSMTSEPMAMQKQKLDTAFEEWKGDLEQLDDVTIIGVRI